VGTLNSCSTGVAICLWFLLRTCLNKKMLINTTISPLCIKQTGTWCVLQGSVETPIRWGGQLCYHFAVNSMVHPGAKFYLHTTSFDKVITKEKRGTDFGPPCTIATTIFLATSIVHSKLDYCNSYFNLQNSELNRLQQIQNFFARTVLKSALTHQTLLFSSICTIAKCQEMYWIKTFYSLTYSSYYLSVYM